MIIHLGLIAKVEYFQALILLATFRERSKTGILNSTRSILFFGVHHRGFPPSFTSLFNLMTTIVPYFSSVELPSTNELKIMLELFAPISDRFQIYTMCDTRLSVGSRSLGFGDSMSYYLGLSNEELVYLNVRYADLVRYESSDSPEYQRVLGILRSIQSQYGLQEPKSEWRADQLFRLGGAERYDRESTVRVYG